MRQQEEGGVSIKPSERLELIIYIMEECRSITKWHKDKQTEAELEETNLTHELEGVGSENRTPPNYEQRAKIATRLQNVLIKRRVAKDTIRINQPLLKFVESDLGAKALNQLKQTLGELRKVENDMAERIYNKRGLNSQASNPDMEKKLNKLIRKWKSESRKKH